MSADAPPATKADCELEIAHVRMLAERWDAAGEAYGDWLEAHADDPRADEAGFYRGVCLKTAGKTEDAEEAMVALQQHARQELWRAQAALLVGAIRLDREDKAGAYAVYRDLAAADWARDVRPQALIGAARAAPDAGAWKKALTELVKRYPASPEAAEAAAQLKQPRPATPRFGIQVGAYGRKRGAEADLKAWRARGRSVAVVRRAGMGLSLYCVVIGPYASRDQADADAAALKGRGVSALVIAY